MNKKELADSLILANPLVAKTEIDKIFYLLENVIKYLKHSNLTEIKYIDAGINIYKIKIATETPHSATYYDLKIKVDLKSEYDSYFKLDMDKPLEDVILINKYIIVAESLHHIKEIRTYVIFY